MKNKLGKKKNGIKHICEDPIHAKEKCYLFSSDVYCNLQTDTAITFSFYKPNLYFRYKSILILYIGI